MGGSFRGDMLGVGGEMEKARWGWKTEAGIQRAICCWAEEYLLAEGFAGFFQNSNRAHGRDRDLWNLTLLIAKASSVQIWASRTGKWRFLSRFNAFLLSRAGASPQIAVEKGKRLCFPSVTQRKYMFQRILRKNILNFEFEGVQSMPPLKICRSDIRLFSAKGNWEKADTRKTPCPPPLYLERQDDSQSLETTLDSYQPQNGARGN